MEEIKVTPDEYREFIKGLTLHDIRLSEGHVHSQRADVDASSHSLRIHEDAHFTPTSSGFEVRHRYKLELEEEDTEKPCCGHIEAVFVLRFNSAVPISEDIFYIFRRMNLNMNTWPYWREYVQSSAARLGWPTITLPLVKDLRQEAEKPGKKQSDQSDQKPAKPRKKAIKK